ncbi:MAG: glycerol-3-phosphate acyltransferase [Chloroflexi bacterium]|nr:glycerol-3-phosphate acyltransferase [Chloroflexota bacterium]
MIIIKFLLILIVGYLLGSIPFGLLIARQFAKVDIRTVGSGKIGSTNVLRTAGKKAAALSLFLDGMKGAIAVLLAALIFGRNYLVVGDFGLGLLVAQCLGGLAAIAGHNWSIFLKFKGGRGVATFFGSLAALSPVVALFGGQVFAIGVGLTRFASLGSIAGAVGTYTILIPLTLLDGFPVEYLVFSLIGTIVIIYMHRDNISRLLAGKERRVGEKVLSSEASPIQTSKE